MSFFDKINNYMIVNVIKEILNTALRALNQTGQLYNPPSPTRHIIGHFRVFLGNQLHCY